MCLDDFQGRIELFLGCMGSGKSDRILAEAKRYELGKKKVLYMAPPDTGSQIKSRSGRTVDCIDYLSEDTDNYDILCIDEGQFFKGLAEYADRMAQNNKIVLIAALDATFERKAFNQVHELIPISEKITKLAGVCVNCGRDSGFSAKLDKTNKNETDIGQSKYISLCRKCHKEQESQL